jgi:hypothetical protein
MGPGKNSLYDPAYKLGFGALNVTNICICRSPNKKKSANYPWARKSRLSPKAIDYKKKLIIIFIEKIAIKHNQDIVKSA